MHSIIIACPKRESLEDRFTSSGRKKGTKFWSPPTRANLTSFRVFENKNLGIAHSQCRFSCRTNSAETISELTCFRNLKTYFCNLFEILPIMNPHTSLNVRHRPRDAYKPCFISLSINTSAIFLNFCFTRQQLSVPQNHVARCIPVESRKATELWLQRIWYKSGNEN